MSGQSEKAFIRLSRSGNEHTRESNLSNQRDLTNSPIEIFGMQLSHCKRIISPWHGPNVSNGEWKSIG